MNRQTQGLIDPEDSNFIIYAGRRLARVRGAESVPGQPPAGVQPPASGPGAPQGGPATGFNWGLFPDVPEHLRGELEPHLRTVQGHVTRLEQQLAPFKAFTDGGLSADQATQLLGFAQRYESDPKGVWADMTRQLQQAGVIHTEADVDAIVRAADGDFGEDDPVTPAPGANGAGDMPPWAQELMTSVKALEDGRNQDQQTQLQQRQEAARNAALSQMRAKLEEAGYPMDDLEDQHLLSDIIAHRGDHLAAVASRVSHRDALISNFTKTNTKNDGDNTLEVSNVPRPPQRQSKSSDPWAKARDGALQAQRMENNAAAAEGRTE